MSKDFNRQNFKDWMDTLDQESHGSAYSDFDHAARVYEAFADWLEKPPVIEDLMKLPVNQGANVRELYDADGNYVMTCHSAELAALMIEQLNANYLEPEDADFVSESDDEDEDN